MAKKSTLYVLQESLKLWLYLPSSGRGKTVKEIKKGLGRDLLIDEGQLRKRLKALESAGFVENHVEDGNQHWISRGATAELSRWREDAVSYALFQQLRELVPGPFFDALAKRAPGRKRSEAKMEQAYFRWPERVFVRQAGYSLMPPQMGGEIVEVVLKAMSDDTGLEGEYRSAEASSAVLKQFAPPIGLLAKGNLLYLIALQRRERSGLQPYLYRLDRFRRLRGTTLPAVATIEEFRRLTSSGLGDFAPPPERFRAWASPYMVSILREQPLAEEMLIHPVDPESLEKGFHVTVLNMSMGFHFVGYLINNSADLVCLEPAETRSQIMARLSSAIAALSKPCQGSKRRRQVSTGDVTLKAWVDDRRGESFCETPFCWGASVHPISLGGASGYALEATLQLTQDIENYIAAQAEGFIVQTPADLRARMLARHRAGFSAYNKHQL